MIRYRALLAGVLLLTCFFVAGCHAKGNGKSGDERPFFYGTWDAGFFDGYEPSTVTFDKDTVTTEQIIDGRDIKMPRTYRVVSQKTDGSIQIMFTGHPHPETSTLIRKDKHTLIWKVFGQTKTMKRVESQ